MLMTPVRKHGIKDYWSADHLITPPMFNDTMPRDRFLLILKFVHFNDDSSQFEGDRLYEIRPVTQHLKEKFDNTLVLYQNLCIDDSMMLWKGGLQFKQFIPTSDIDTESSFSSYVIVALDLCSISSFIQDLKQILCITESLAS